MLFSAGCKKYDVVIPESKIEQLRNQVSDWYHLSAAESLTDPDASTKKIASNSLNTQSSTDYSLLFIDSLNFNRSYINFDSLSLTGLTVPMRINKNTGEYIQLTTISNNKKTKGYFVRSIPDENWYKKLGVKSDFSRMSGKIFVYTLKGKLISKAILVDGLVSNNLTQNQLTFNGNIKSNSWGYDENGLFDVTVNSYIRHNSWYDLISLAIFDSGNDLGISLGSDYVPFYPFDPNYGAPGGGGSMGGVPAPIISQQQRNKEWNDTRVKNLTNNPCVTSVLKTLENVNNCIPGLVKSFYNDDPGFGITINWVELKDINGNPRDAYAETINNKYTDEHVINLNSNYNKQTDLALALSLFHEALHCQFLTWFYKAIAQNDELQKKILIEEYGSIYSVDLGNIDSSYTNMIKNGNTGHHNFMADKYVSQIGLALYDFALNRGYMNITRAYCDDLAWSGLQYSDAFNSTRLSDDKRKYINSIIRAEKDPTGSAGIKGPQDPPAKADKCEN